MLILLIYAYDDDVYLNRLQYVVLLLILLIYTNDDHVYLYRLQQVILLLMYTNDDDDDTDDVYWNRLQHDGYKNYSPYEKHGQAIKA